MTEVYAVLYAEGNPLEVFGILNRRGYRLQHKGDKIDPNLPTFVPLARANIPEIGDVKGLLLRRAYRERINSSPHPEICRRLAMRRPGSVLFQGVPAHGVKDLERAIQLMSMVARPLFEQEIPLYLMIEERTSQDMVFGLNPRRNIKQKDARLVLELGSY